MTSMGLIEPRLCPPLLALVMEACGPSGFKTYLGTSKPEVHCHILTEGLDLEILGELAPGAFHYGMTCLIEFEPDSLWHEASLTIAAEAVKHGIKTEYHVFQNSPADIRAKLRRMGLDPENFEEKGSLRIIDNYTPTTPLKSSTRRRSEELLSGRSPKLEQWNRAIRDKIRQGFDSSEQRWLHIDDNEAILLEYNTEEFVTNGWRTIFLPMAKARQLLTLHALATGIASDSFYRKRESLVDAVIDFKTGEDRGKLSHFIRVRALRGSSFDSAWRRLEHSEGGRVRLSSGKQVFGFENQTTERVFDYLLRSFVDDHVRESTSVESSGWRTLVDVATNIGVAPSLLYSPKASVFIGEPLRNRIIERRIFPKERGRGGRVTRLRVAYQNPSVKEFVDRYMQK
jgi:KaiC/GvpD/RAD55 family RecA-like ATPase